MDNELSDWEQPRVRTLKETGLPCSRELTTSSYMNTETIMIVSIQTAKETLEGDG